MRKAPLSVAAISVLSAVSVFAQRAPEQLYESNAPAPNVPIVITLDNDGFFATPSRWGRPRVLQTLDGTRVFMYAQGLPDVNIASPHDQVWLFQNPNTWAGWNSNYSLATPLRILPSTAGVGSDVTANYAHQWPYYFNSRFYMTANMQPLGAPGFNELLMGTSADGKAWAWRKFLRGVSTLTVDQVAWKEITIGGASYEWGFVDVKRSDGTPGIAAIRFQHSATPGCTWCFDVNASPLAIWSVGQWKTVPTCASVGDTSGYDFCLYTSATNQSGTSIEPDILTGLAAIRHASFHKLTLFTSPHYELWAQNQFAQVPPSPCGCAEAGSAFVVNQLYYWQITPPVTLTANPNSSIGTRQLVQQQASTPARCMPSSSDQFRATPFRLEWTKELLYSRTFDSKSNPFQCGDGRGYIVRTKLACSGAPCSP